MNAITQSANDWVGALSTYQPGKPIEEVARELCLGDPEGIIKLASNENALGPSPKAVAAMKAAAARMHTYPDGDCYYLRQALARRLGVPPELLFLGHGSNEIIQLLGHVYLGPGRNIVISRYAFVVYQLVAALYRAETRVAPDRDLGHDLDAIRAAITPQTRLVFVANPNNPTGTMASPDALDGFIRRVPEHVVVVIDEAYIEILPPAEQPDTLRYVREGRSVVVLRTFSKVYGLAGLRIGYAIAPEPAVALLHRVRQPFNVNAMAQAAALAALEDDEHVGRARAMVRDGLIQLAQGLDRMGIAYVPSRANFLLVKVGNGQGLFEALQRQRVIVRPVGVYGLPEYVRVTVGTREENERFLEALAAVRRQGAKA